MRNLFVLFINLVAALARLLGLGGVRSLFAESVLIKDQLVIVESFPATRRRKPGTQGPSLEPVQVVVEMTRKP